MKPPTTLNVLDRHGGVTAITRSRTYVKVFTEGTSNFIGWRQEYHESGTLWRPGGLLVNPEGVLQEFDENSFYQNNTDVTKAVYKCKSYPYRIAVWFDNETGRRIA